MKVVLAYSGGLDTSVIIKWLQDKSDADVVTLTMELGQEGEDLAAIEKKAKKLGAVATYSIDARAEFVAGYVNLAICANGLYEGRYPLSTAIGRPLIAKHLVDVARKEGADAVAHGSTGKGNDQVRFEASIRALDSDLKILAPIREWPMSREDEIAYAKEHGISVPVTVEDPYSYDVNLWGKSAEAGPLEDPAAEPLEEPFWLTSSPEKAPDTPEYVELEFEQGVPVSLNGKKKDEVALITELNALAATHGVGRIDMIEDRLVGIKSRETYECPAATVILCAHKELERLTLTRDQFLHKQGVDAKWAELVYFGQWYEPLMDDLNAYIDSSQRYVNGWVRLKLYKGTATVVGRTSEDSLYDYGLTTYDESDTFDHAAAEGFIKLWGLPQQVAGIRARKKK